MKKIKRGLYWHVYHNSLVDYCYDYDGRREYIEQHKPAHEREERIRIMQPVKGKLPDEVYKAAVFFAEAGVAYDKAAVAYDKAAVAYDKAAADYTRVSSASDKAWVAYTKAWVAYGKARVAYGKALEANNDAIESLHAKECKDCSWDGERLTFAKKEKND